jgi:hypothetical protein
MIRCIYLIKYKVPTLCSLFHMKQQPRSELIVKNILILGVGLALRLYAFMRENQLNLLDTHTHSLKHKR